MNMAYLTLTCAALSSSAVLLLPLMPRQKGHVRELTKHPRSKLAARAMIVLLLLLMLVGTCLAMLPIFPQTACLRLAGGTGC
jgi:hypothetical protein